MDRKRIAIVGGGIAGLTAAWRLHPEHELILLEKNDYVGGHTRTLTIPDGPDAGTPVDTGFIVMNHRNYPVLTQLFEEWEVELEDSDMSFSYHDERSGYAYAGTNLRGLFPSVGTIVSPAHWRMIRDLKRFATLGTRFLDGPEDEVTLGSFLDEHRFSRPFREHYLYAMGAAIWSAPPAALHKFPARPYLQFFQNHGLLTLKDRPKWRYVKGGSHSYVRKLLDRMPIETRLNAAPAQILREPTQVRIQFDGQEDLLVDDVVIATHADEALGLLGDPSPEEEALLGAWSYQPNTVVLHRAEQVMPRFRHAWASWNFAREPGFEAEKPVSVSYWMNRLQNLQTENNYFVTLNRVGPLPASEVINETTLHHPQYDQAALDSQARLQSLQGLKRTWFCGSYFGYGFHEDAARSGQRLAERLQETG